MFKARALDPNSSELFERIFEFASQSSVNEETNGDANKAIVKDILTKETKTLLGGKSVAEFLIESFCRVKNHSLTDLPTRVAVMKALVLSKTGTVEDATSLLLNGGLEGRKVSVVNCRKAIKCLTLLGGDLDDAKKQWITQVKAKFPLAKDLE